jgi:hypothetical protein
VVEVVEAVGTPGKRQPKRINDITTSTASTASRTPFESLRKRGLHQLPHFEPLTSLRHLSQLKTRLPELRKAAHGRVIRTQASEGTDRMTTTGMSKTLKTKRVSGESTRMHLFRGAPAVRIRPRYQETDQEWHRRLLEWPKAARGTRPVQRKTSLRLNCPHCLEFDAACGIRCSRGLPKPCCRSFIDHAATEPDTANLGRVPKRVGFGRLRRLV